MNIYRHNWYDVGGALFVAPAYLMGFWGAAHLTAPQIILQLHGHAGASV